jgi:hypothetical protein
MAMPIHIACPHCSRPLQIPAAAGNTPIQCPYCRGLSRVPQLIGREPATVEVRPPAGPPRDPYANPWAGITAMVLGIVGLVFACLPMCSAPLGLIAVILGFVGLSCYKGGRGMATAGLILGACGVVLSIVLMILALTWNPPNLPADREPTTAQESGG